MSNTDLVKWTLLDTDLTTQTGGDVPALESNLYPILNETGTGEIRMSLDSIMAGLVDFGMFFRCEYRGTVRGGFFVDNIRYADANSSEGGGRVLSVSGRGALAIFEKEIIYDNGSGATTRAFTDMSKAAILIQLIDEAQAKGGLATLTYDFTASDDSVSTAWTDNENLELPVGTKLLEVIRQFTKTGVFDVDINLVGGGFVLSAYSAGLGSNKTSTVYFRIGHNCQEFARDNRAGSELVNEYLVKWKNGFFPVRDNTSITAHGRNVDFLNIEQAQSVASATTFASAKLAINKDPKESKTVLVWDGLAPNVYLDYVMGDTISLDRFGTVTEDRILGLQLNFSGETFAGVTVDFNVIFLEHELQMQQDLDYLLNSWSTAKDANLLETTFWSIFASVGTSVEDFLLLGGYLYVVGNGKIGTATTRGIGKYKLADGTWQNVGNGAGMPFAVTAICEIAGTLYIATDTGAGAHKVYYLDGGLSGTWTLLGTFNAVVAETERINALLSWSGYLMVACENVADVDGTPIAHNVALWNGSSWQSWGSVSDDTTSCKCLVFYHGQVHGGFAGTAIGDQGLQYYSEGDNEWHVEGLDSLISDQNVNALEVQYDNLIIAADETVAIWDGSASDWEVIATLGSGTTVYAVALNLTDIYIGGDFHELNGVTDYNSLAKYSGGAWSMLGVVGAIGIEGTVADLVFTDEDLYIGGSFDVAGGKPAASLAAYITNFQNALDKLEQAGRNIFDMGAEIHNATASAITDNDEVPFWEDVSQALRKITWANIKSTLKTYFDTLYAAVTFKTISVSGQSDVVADSITDTLTLVAGSNVTITTNASTDSITIAASGGSYTDEQAQDAVGGALDNGTTGQIKFTYDDATPKISGDVVGINWKHTAVNSAGTLPSHTYDNSAGTITMNATGILSVTGSGTVHLNDYIVVALSNAESGLYKCTTEGAVGVYAVLTRSIDMNTASQFLGACIMLTGGDNLGRILRCTNNTVPTLGTTTIGFAFLESAMLINATQVGTGGVDNTEFGYLNGVTSAIQTQLDSKLSSVNIEDAINDGVTDKAPSENAVFDALALKQNSLGFTAENVANKDTDGTLAANSDTKYASQKATKTYADTVSSNASVIAKVLTAFSAGAGTVSATDSILQAFQKVVGNIALKLTANSPITGATKTKITYDANGLVTLGADATTADIADSTNKRYVTDAQQTVIGNTSGTNTGDETAARIATINHGASVKSALVDADEITGQDSAASFGLIRTTWTSVKAFLKTYFDTLYQAAGTYLTSVNIEDAIIDAHTTIAPSGNAVFDALALKAPLASPALTGSPTAPTQSAQENSTKIATTAYVDGAVLNDNIFLNGGLDIWQRSTDDTGVTTTRKYVADGFAITTSAATLSHVRRSTTIRTGGLSLYSIQLDGQTSMGTVDMDQRLPANAAGRYKRTVMFSAWVYNGIGASVTPVLLVSTPSATDNWASSTVRNGGGSGENLQACADAAWTQVTWTADVSGYTNIDNGIEFKIRIPTATLNTTGKFVRYAEIKLEKGSVASPIKPQSYADALRDCLHWTYVLDATTNTSNNGLGAKYSTTNILVQVTNPVPMFAAPTLTHNVTGYTNSAPGTTTIGLIDYARNAFFAITGALTLTLSSANKYSSSFNFAAGTSWDGTSGNQATLRIGPSVVMVLSCAL